MTTPTIIAGTRVGGRACFDTSRSCESFGASAGVACVFASGVCASITFLRALRSDCCRMSSDSLLLSMFSHAAAIDENFRVTPTVVRKLGCRRAAGLDGFGAQPADFDHAVLGEAQPH